MGTYNRSLAGQTSQQTNITKEAVYFWKAEPIGEVVLDQLSYQAYLEALTPIRGGRTT